LKRFLIKEPKQSAVVLGNWSYEH